MAVGPRRLLHDRRLDGRAAAGATRGRRCGVTWLPWGPQTQGLLIYRHMLPDPSFSAGDPERAASSARSARRWAATTRAAAYLADARRTSSGAAAAGRLSARPPRLPPLMAPITVSARSGAPEDTAADTRVVGLFEGETLADPALQRLVELGEAKRGLKKVAVAHEDAPGGGQRRVLIAGLGKRDEFGAEQARVAAAAAAARAKELGAESLSWAAPEGEGVAGRARRGHAAQAVRVRPLQVAERRRRRTAASSRSRSAATRWTATRSSAAASRAVAAERRARPAEPARERRDARRSSPSARGRSPTSTRRSRSRCSAARRSSSAAWARSPPSRRAATPSRG